MLLWKSMESGLRSGYNGEKWELGKWKKTEGYPGLCKNGYHGSKNIIDAMGYTNLGTLARIEVRGESAKGSDKQCWTEARVVEAWKWEKEDSVALAIYASELVLKNFEKELPKDRGPRGAIEAAKAWLKNPTKEARSAAESAWSAARSAWSAESAWSAWSAESAWSAAESAAYNDIMKKCHRWVLRRRSRLERIHKGNK